MTLALLAVLSLLLALALGGAAGDTALAANRQFRFGAFEAAESGLVAARSALLGTPAVAIPALDLRLPDSTVEGAVTLVRHVGDGMAPVGYSMDRFVLRQFELRSTGRSARSATLTLVESIDRLDARP
ncbi:MAG: hypothetical protein RLZZ200_796 [Pseudomonadota bacterium]